MISRPAIALSSLAVIALGAGAATAAEHTIKFSHILPPTHKAHQGIEMWAESLAEASGGRIEVQIYPAQQLGKAQDHFDMVRDGVAEMGWLVPGYQPGRWPLASACSLPFLVSDAAKGSRVFQEWYAPLAKEEMPEVRMCIAYTHDPGRLHTTEPVLMPGDMEGKRFRAPTGVMGSYMSDLGAAVVPLPAPEVRQGLESGVIDSLSFPWNTIRTFGLDRKVTEHLDIPFYTAELFYIMNRDFYEGLPDDLKAVVDAHCNADWAEKVAADWTTWEQAGRPLLEEDGHTITIPDETVVAAWKEAAQPLYQGWVDGEAGIDPARAQDLIDDLSARLAAAGASN